MKESNTPKRSGLMVIVISACVCFLVFFIPWLFFVQAVTGMFSPLQTDRGNIAQWCENDAHKRIKSPVFSSDGSQLVWTVLGACKIAIYDLATESLVYLTPPNGTAVYGATFHPRVNTIAFILVRQTDVKTMDYQLAVSRIDGTKLKILTSSDTRKRFPSYALDGKKIVFEASQRCKSSYSQYCGSDLYEFDLEAHKETRISTWNATQAGPAHFLPGNKKIVTHIVRSSELNELGAVHVAATDGVFMVDINDAARYEPLVRDIPTASSPRPLPSGEIAFIARVNEYEKVQGPYIYDVFLWGNAGSRRLTESQRFIWDYAISNDAKYVVLVTNENMGSSQCELLMWDVSQNIGRQLKCKSVATELRLQ